MPDRTTTNRSTPPTTDVISGVASVGVGNAHTCVLMQTGGVRCWGSEHDGLPSTVADPPSTDLLTGVKALATGASFNCALMQTGGIRCWGSNENGQFGNGTTSYKGSKTADYEVLTDVRAVAAGGGHTCALMATGGVRCWGWNRNGQLGDGTTTDRSTPPGTDVLKDVQALSAGDEHTCALMMNGGVRCWGWNGWGQLGDGSSSSRSTPPSSDVLTGVRAISAGSNHTCALMMTGGVRCWGNNGGGQLGYPAIDHSRPTLVTGLCD